jgi:hypothetical protein
LKYKHFDAKETKEFIERELGQAVKKERRPTKAELEWYASSSGPMKNFVEANTDLEIISPVKYIGNLRFEFTCKNETEHYELDDPEDVASYFENSKLEGYHAAPAGKGEFNYPSKTVGPRNRTFTVGEFLFDYVIANRKKIKM